jgi:uncharacterized membrane protein (DUF106 family)
MNRIEELVIEDANQVLAIDRRMKKIDEEMKVIQDKIKELEKEDGEMNG